LFKNGFKRKCITISFGHLNTGPISQCFIVSPFSFCPKPFFHCRELTIAEKRGISHKQKRLVNTTGCQWFGFLRDV
jgi:hypothetical protein